MSSTESTRGVRCRKCGCPRHRVLYTRQTVDGRIRRRRECEFCGHRFTTYEKLH